MGVPISLAAGSDGSIYVLFLQPSRVMRFPAGSSDPVPLPFEFGSGISDPSPCRVTVTAVGDVIGSTDRDLRRLPKGAQAPSVIGTGHHSKLFIAVDPKGAIYYADAWEDLQIIEGNSTTPRTFEERDRANPTRKIAAMAFDTNGDRYTVTESCGENLPSGVIRPCNTYVYALSKLTNNSTVSIDIPVRGLTSATSVAVDSTAIYIADGNRVVKVAE